MFTFVLGLDLTPDSTTREVMNQWSQTYFFRQSELYKWVHLGIDIRQHIFLRGSAISKSQLWFSDYINHSPPDGWAHITIHFSFHGCRISVADVQLLRTMVNSEADPTAHVVNEILYGANSLLILEEPIGIDETKESAEDRLFLAAKCLAEGGQDIVGLSDFTQCRFYSDLPGEKPLTGTLIECFSKMEEIMFKMQDSDFHIPVKATLTPLSTEVKCRPYSCLDNALYVSTMIQNLILEAANDLLSLLADPFIQRTYRMRPYLLHFFGCLNQLSIANNNILTIGESCPNEKKEELAIRLWQTYFVNRPLTEWLIQRRRGLAIVNRLLQDIDLSFLSKAELPDLTAGQVRKIFILKTVKRKDPFLEQFCLDFGTPESPEWSILDIISSTDDHIDLVRSKLVEFAAETDDGLAIQRFISTSSYHEDAHVITESFENFDDDLTIRGTRLLKRGNPSIYLLQAETKTDVGQFRWFELGFDSSRSSRHRTILLMGASGSGKSTLVDSIVNYILNVQWTDPFRFRVDPESSDNQRKLVTAYTIHHVDGMSIPYSLTIIDTPGYNGDVESDIQTTQLIANFLTHEKSRQTYQTIDAICLVADSTQKIACSAQGNVIEVVKFLFAGCDYASKVHWYCTFASNPKKSPAVLETISPHIFPTSLHYEFENSILFAPKRVRYTDETEEDYALGQTHWDKAWDNHRSFFSQWNTMDEPYWIATPTVDIARNSICVASS